MKTIIACLMILSSISAFADELKFSVDWERIERGMKTGDFSCRGTCARISIDWNETVRTLSGQKYADKKRADIYNCVSEYHTVRENFDRIEVSLNEGMINECEASSLRHLSNMTLLAVDNTCKQNLGKKKAMNLKQSILDFEIVSDVQ